jgi:hypothetical protein
MSRFRQGCDGRSGDLSAGGPVAGVSWRPACDRSATAAVDPSPDDVTASWGAGSTPVEDSEARSFSLVMRKFVLSEGGPSPAVSLLYLEHIHAFFIAPAEQEPQEAGFPNPSRENPAPCKGSLWFEWLAVFAIASSQFRSVARTHVAIITMTVATLCSMATNGRVTPPCDRSTPRFCGAPPVVAAPKATATSLGRPAAVHQQAVAEDE